MLVRVETGVIRAISRAGKRATVIVLRGNKEYRVTILLSNGRTYFNYNQDDLGEFDTTRLKEFPEAGTTVVLYCEEHNPLFAKLWSEQPQASGRRLGSIPSLTVHSANPQTTVIRRPIRNRQQAVSRSTH